MTTPDNFDLTGIGEHRPDHRRGFLVFTHLPPEVQDAEDSTAYADLENRYRRAVVHRDRDATAAERALLTHLGHSCPPGLQTRVRWVSNGVRNRSWPALKIAEDGTTDNE